MRRVVVTGLGVVSPLGIGKEDHWKSVVSGRSAIMRSRRLADQGFPIDMVAEIQPETIKAHISRLPRKQLKFLSRAALLGMLASSLAVEDAGLENGFYEPARFGAFLATFFTTLDLRMFLRWVMVAESEEEARTMDLVKANAYCMASVNPVDYSLKTMPNLAGGHMAIAHNTQGFCRVIADGCTGGPQAVGQAYLSIKEGELDVAICGGTEAPLEEFVFVNFCTLSFLARPPREVEAACCPFDARRSGAVLGEGAGILVLEELEHAIKRGARIYGEIIGYGSAAGDASVHEVEETDSMVEDVAGRIGLAIETALAEAGLDHVDFIAANGDSTVRNDLAETKAIKRIFGSRAKEIAVAATKAMHGHPISASGVMEFIHCLLALDEGIIPPTINLHCPDPLCDLDYVPNRARFQEGLKTALANSVGLFGESASLVVRRPS